MLPEPNRFAAFREEFARRVLADVADRSADARVSTYHSCR
jgi:hypothetical protein